MKEEEDAAETEHGRGGVANIPDRKDPVTTAEAGRPILERRELSLSLSIAT